MVRGPWGGTGLQGVLGTFCAIFATEGLCDPRLCGMTRKCVETVWQVVFGASEAVVGSVALQRADRVGAPNGAQRPALQTDPAIVRHFSETYRPCILRITPSYW
jgi:hypothetical protein